MSTPALLEEGITFLSKLAVPPAVDYKNTPFKTLTGFRDSSYPTRITAFRDDPEFAKYLLRMLDKKLVTYFFPVDEVKSEEKSDSSEPSNSDDVEYTANDDGTYSASHRKMTFTPTLSKRDKVVKFIEAGNSYEDNPSTRQYLMDLHSEFSWAFSTYVRDDFQYQKFFKSMSPYFDLPLKRPTDETYDISTTFRVEVEAFKGIPLAISQMKQFGEAKNYAAGLPELFCLGRLMNEFTSIRSFYVYGYGTSIEAVMDSQTRPCLVGDFANLVTNGPSALPAVYQDSLFAKNLIKAQFSTLKSYFERITAPIAIK